LKKNTRAVPSAADKTTKKPASEEAGWVSLINCSCRMGQRF